MSEFRSATAVQLLFEALGRGQHPLLSVTSDSMAPLFRQGDQIQLAPALPDSLVVGDVVVIGPQDDLLAHRYWGVAESAGSSCFVTRGDRLAYYDPLLPASQLKAIVIGRQRSGRLLDLRRGPGNWLNRRLTQLARLEARAIGLEHPAPDHGIKNQVRPRTTGRIARRLLATIGTLLAMLVELLA